ncbi:MAG: hypothetical protein H6706_28180 [Myxococcales bacterium]|nr:hypothetical protein [Myxococcales bacterium]
MALRWKAGRVAALAWAVAMLPACDTDGGTDDGADASVDGGGMGGAGGAGGMGAPAASSSSSAVVPVAWAARAAPAGRWHGGAGAGGMGGVGGAGGMGGAGGAGGMGGAGGEGPCTDGDEMACDLDGCAGTTRCEAGAWTPCEGGAEACDGLDNDCDGLLDEGYEGLGEACSAGVGACQADGMWTCTVDGADVMCDAVAGEGSPEVCNEVDDDCDGTVDNGAPAEACYGGPAGTAGVGRCAAGERACAPDAPCVGEVLPGDEACNEIDDDCDGAVDEGACARCGDGNVDMGEACDDGNLVDGDGCSSMCAVEDVVALGANQGFGHHGECMGFNDCGDARTCADAACALRGFGPAVDFRQTTCGEARQANLDFQCNLFHQLPGPLDEGWNGDAFCPDILVAFDVVCSLRDPETNPDCARNPLWEPVACQTGEWVWTSDRAQRSVADADAARTLWTALVGDAGEAGRDARCSLDGTGYLSTQAFVMNRCDDLWFHLGGRFTGECGGHDGEPVRRLTMNPQGCFDYRDLPPPGPLMPMVNDLGNDCRGDGDCASGICWDWSQYDAFCGGRACSVGCRNDADCEAAFRGAGAPSPGDSRCGADGRCTVIGTGFGAFFCQ